MAERVTAAKQLGFWGKLKRLALTDVGALVRGLKAGDVEAMERLMLEADFGLPATADLVDFLEAGIRKGTHKTEADLRTGLEQRIAGLLAGPDQPSVLVRAPAGPTVVLFVGVNGVGKTTTVAKLAERLRRQHLSVLLVAADTWRAGAVAQLGVWAERLGVECVSGAQGGDPADIIFGRFSIKRRIVKYVFQTYRCRACKTAFGIPERYRICRKHGWDLIAYFLYQIVEMSIPQRIVAKSFNRLFGYSMHRSTLNNMEVKAAGYYAETKRIILESIVRGGLVHADETRANIKGKSAFVWVLTSMRAVAYIYTESREGEIVEELLANFKGVLVSDFVMQSMIQFPVLSRSVSSTSFVILTMISSSIPLTKN